MQFGNEIVGQSDMLVRPAIQSENFQAGVSGWRITRAGNAEFFNVTARGEMIVGVPPSPPNPYIHARILSGVPTIAFYDGTHTLPARIQAYDLGGNGGLVLDTGDIAVESTALALGGNIASLLYDKQTGTLDSAMFKVGPPQNEIVKLRASAAGTQDVEFGIDLVNTTPDTFPGRLYTVGEIYMNHLAPDANYATRVADGKGPQSVSGTTIGTTDTNIGSANVVNTYVEDGYAYRCIIHVDMRNANVGGRLDFKLWDGPVGGSQLGGINRRWTENSSAGANNGGTMLIFAWRQFGTGILANINLSAVKTVVTAAAATVEVNAAYLAIVEKIGDANKISGL